MFDLEMLELVKKPSDWTGQHCYVIWFCISWVIHHDCKSEFIWMSKLSYDKYYDNFTKIEFSDRWLVRAVIQNQDTRFPTEVESGFRILK